MAEISRLDAIRSDQAKADFISSISRTFSPHPQLNCFRLTLVDEIRSPLHGILASADFLRELTSEEPQVELISTVQHCGRTLLVGRYLSGDIPLSNVSAGYHQPHTGFQQDQLL